ncbi:7970_t:CDS:10 [Ambispora leptoticha]|uniref:7970_t:CDS:1 n=1 Tax=Ambispora leptoticha TaxID=144679 RepID=A0A9N9E502_9GLOM|nr:7970_t:CDS:10 [Ambispora leptoticha]
MSEPNTTQDTILIPPNLYYKEYWLNTSFQDWSVESFDIFWIQQNPTLHQRQDRAHTSLAIELKILSEASDQRVAEKALLLHKSLKCKKSAEIIDIIWDQSKEIADSKVRLTLSELLTKTKIKTNIIGEIGDLGSKSSPDAISAVQPQNEKNRNKHAIREDSQSDDLFKKINEDDEEFLENVGLLFNESNEESIIEKVDENSLLDEVRLPSVNINNKTSEEFLDTNTIEAFSEYQKKIPKTRKALTPAYWGILDLTKESLKNSGIKDMAIQKLSQDFSNKIGWNDVTAPKEIQEYFDRNCVDVDNIDVIKKLDRNVQFMVDKLPKLRKTCTEEELKMSTTFPLFSGIFNSPGEIRAISTNKARNEEQNPFMKARIGHKVDMKGTLVKTPNKFEIIYGEISGGLTSFGLPASCRKKQYVDKVKLMVMLRDSLNQFFKNYLHVTDKQRKKLIVYGWLQVGVELSFYAMDWIGCGIYRFGKLDKCELPVDEGDLSILEDAYCILRLLESKSLESEKIIKEILQNNTKNKRRRMMTESNPHLNNRTPIK